MVFHSVKISGCLHMFLQCKRRSYKNDFVCCAYWLVNMPNTTVNFNVDKSPLRGASVCRLGTLGGNCAAVFRRFIPEKNIKC